MITNISVELPTIVMVVSGVTVMWNDNTIYICSNQRDRHSRIILIVCKDCSANKSSDSISNKSDVIDSSTTCLNFVF